eukprot:scaffold2805_cov202-Prasinococcus_capsulatus_cf.AAC.7
MGVPPWPHGNLPPAPRSSGAPGGPIESLRAARRPEWAQNSPKNGHNDVFCARPMKSAGPRRLLHETWHGMCHPRAPFLNVGRGDARLCYVVL